MDRAAPKALRGETGERAGHRTPNGTGDAETNP